MPPRRRTGSAKERFFMADIDALMRTAPVIPVLVIDRLEDAVPIAEALVGGGLPLLEVTLRTPVALDAISAMAEVPGAVVGAGTVLGPTQLDAAQAAGAKFIVSPGLTEPLARAATAADIDYLPGVATAADIMRGIDLGLDRFKFFPAETIGGLKALKAYAAVFRDVRFCPTGGVTQDSAPTWLADPAVLCVGGSWLVPAGEVDPDAITARAKAAAELRPRG
jgi:2-dehydro-3-deoxyphosphogluconate aldolase/(4S)-4-hydroxy-2-oxoglutarate aldolase